MILSEIKKYFIEHPAASLADLSIRFNIDPDAMRGMLDQWIRKGRLRKLEQAGSCSNCCSNCKSKHMEIYEWIEER
ncbi:MAG: sugar metabolism transcriptional regulator [Deltaproteobacteria bacterium]|nr:sugar metabolism transcriptional regulator [Deltaproteobacteria bacterium]